MVGDRARERLMRELSELRGIKDTRVLEAMRKVPRHSFVDEGLAGHAYGYANLPIGEGQTLSQPYTVARMTEALGLRGEEEVLEIGTGSGYHTAILAELCRKVHTVERLPQLADLARKRLRRLSYRNVVFRVGDGSRGWPEERQFDRILVTAGSPAIPRELIRQLAPNGILVAPEGNLEEQLIIKLTRSGHGGREGTLVREVLEACRFVPLVGESGWKEGGT